MVEENTGAEPTRPDSKPGAGTAASGARSAPTTGAVVDYSVPPGPQDEDLEEDPAATAASGGAVTPVRVVAYSVPPAPPGEHLEEAPPANLQDPD